MTISREALTNSGPITTGQTRETEWPSALNEQLQPTLTIKDNDLFLITDRLGNTTTPKTLGKYSTITGLFSRDTRFLSRSELQIEGKAPVLLSYDASGGSELCAICTNPDLPGRLKRDTIGIVRRILLRGGLFEELEVTNYTTHPVSFQLSLSFGADFLDLFEVKQYAQRPARGDSFHTTVDDSPQTMSFTYRGLDHTVVESRLEFMETHPSRLQGQTAIWHLQLEPRASCKLGYRLLTFADNQPTSQVEAPATLKAAQGAAREEKQAWDGETTRIRTDSFRLNQIIEQAERDIYLLRQSFGEGKVLAAGIPWFSTLFGRDAIIAAGQTLMLNSAITRDTLLTLAKHQGRTESDWHDESPGKILHELRFGEMARCREIPHTPYYGTVDATPLWLMLYADYSAWTGDRATVDRLWPHALAAMEWIDTQCQETGYLSYFRRSPRGIDNQGWKDSGDCIVNSKGQLVTGAIALSEVQAYVYAAKVRLAELARQRGSSDLAQRWQSEAQDLKARFNRDFWLESENYCALALDSDGNPIDSITSNPGHCLGLGIFTPEKARAVAERLAQPDLFSGWGIRTLSSLSPAYNPHGYHLGTVWPHDSALIAVGLRQIGSTDQALAIAQGLFDMTLHQPELRPPELFCGYPRQGNSAPVNYPVACSPQAWASGSIFQLLQMMLNPIPDAVNNRLQLVAPALPATINHLSVRNLHVGQTRLDLDLNRVDETTFTSQVTQQGDLKVTIES